MCLVFQYALADRVQRPCGCIVWEECHLVQEAGEFRTRRQAGQRANGNEAWIHRRDIVDMAILARESSFLYRDYKQESRGRDIVYTEISSPFYDGNPLNIFKCENISLIFRKQISQKRSTYDYNLISRITMAAQSKASTVFACSNVGIVISNPI
jgi:hypothetical protein